MRQAGALFPLFLLTVFFHFQSFSQGLTNSSKAWTRNPFDHNLFIQNQGQFGPELKTTEKTLYMAKLGSVNAYFTANGLIYRYAQYPKLNNHDRVKGKKGQSVEEEREEEERAHAKPTIHFLNAIWEGANPDARVEAQEKQSYYYTYPSGRSQTIKAAVFKKIIYRDIYPGIDIEYVFPEGNRKGLKYSIIVHPGADVANVRLTYPDAAVARLLSGGNYGIKSGIGELTDHAPSAYYIGEYNGETKAVQVSYALSKNTVSFTVKGTYDKSKTLVIDPWISNPNFLAGYDNACDIDYDQMGNVYAYGSQTPFQLTQFNAAGVQQWTFNATAISEDYYGDFTTDRVTGTCYIVEGLNDISGANVLKINSAGNLVGTYPGNINMFEMWRARFNACTRQIVIGGGGTNSPNSQACLLDTNMSTLTPVNVLLATDGKHDISLMALDPVSSTAYMAVAYPNSASTFFNNDLMSLPLPGLSPFNYLVPDGFNFVERLNINYNQFNANGIVSANGMNGMAASPNWLYIYDGDTLKKLNKATGAIVSKLGLNVPVSSTFVSFGTVYQVASWGGLDADACDNVFVGDQMNINVYNSGLSLINTVPAKDTVYDLVLGQNGTVIYVGGYGFVQSIPNPVTSSVSITHTKTPSLGCKPTGTATPRLLICGSAPVDSISYSWSNGQKTKTATGLAGGTYTVNMSLGCGVFYQDTVTIQGPPLLLVNAQAVSPTSCIASTGVAKAVVTGAEGSVTYNWSTGASSATAKNLAAGTYTITVTDAGGCSSTSSATINPSIPPVATASELANTTCKKSIGVAGVTATGGTGTLTYSWSNGSKSTTISGLAAGLYTVTVVDSMGCSAISIADIRSPGQPGVSITSNINSVCGDSVCVKFTGTVSAGCAGIKWHFGDGDSASTLSPEHCYSKTGSYSVSFSCLDTNGCRGDTAIGNMIHVYTQPKASFSYTPNPVLSGNSVQFKNNSTPASGNTYLWNFITYNAGKDSLTSLVNPVMAFKDTGKFCIRLKAVSVPCIDSTEECLEVVSCSFITDSIPNVFTPNNDGINDVFTTKSSGLTQLSCEIFDRWGIKMAEFNTVNGAWNGRNSGGENAPSGTYYYILNATCFNGAKKAARGFVELIR